MLPLVPARARTLPLARHARVDDECARCLTAPPRRGVDSSSVRGSIDHDEGVRPCVLGLQTAARAANR